MVYKITTNDKDHNNVKISVSFLPKKIFSNQDGITRKNPERTNSSGRVITDKEKV